MFGTFILVGFERVQTGPNIIWYLFGTNLTDSHDEEILRAIYAHHNLSLRQQGFLFEV